MRGIEAPKINQFHQDEFKRMYAELTDDELIEKNRKRAERISRIEDKKIDTGAYEKPRHRQIY